MYNRPHAHCMGFSALQENPSGIFYKAEKPPADAQLAKRKSTSCSRSRAKVRPRSPPDGGARGVEVRLRTLIHAGEERRKPWKQV